jgi:hypothetical protein
MKCGIGCAVIADGEGVAQELHWNEQEVEHSCPVCFQTDPRQTEWHQGNKKLNVVKRHT